MSFLQLRASIVKCAVLACLRSRRDGVSVVWSVFSVVRTLLRAVSRELPHVATKFSGAARELFAVATLF